MPAKQRFLLLGLLGLTCVTALVYGHASAWALVQLGMTDSPQFGLSELPTSKIVGMGLAALQTLILYRVKTTRTWLDEVTDELSRVNWPSREETGHATWVVVICVVVSAAFLGLFDATWLWVSSRIMGITGA